MKFVLIKTIIFTFFILCNANANEIHAKYSVIASGIKIGEFSWHINYTNKKYESKIALEDSGILSSLYKFNGEYTSSGIIIENVFISEEYKQYWETKKKIKIVEMSFNKNLIDLKQIPFEKELARIDLSKVYDYSDPITSFINILNGSNSEKTIDGRRIYVMKRNDFEQEEKITLKILDYKNIWADHNKNDLKKIEFIMTTENFFPSLINIFFKKRVFKLKKI